MKIKEAIEILTINNYHNPNFTDYQRREAHQLGIEALKMWKEHRGTGSLTDSLLLPGETKEE